MQLFGQNLNDKPVIIAEIGNNHEGSFVRACDLVKSAADCGVNVVKFQVFKTDNFVSEAVGQDRVDRLRSFELSYNDFEKLKHLCEDRGVRFLATPLDIESAEFLCGLQSVFKIASSDNNYWRLIERILEKNLKLIISTGLRDTSNVIELYQELEKRQALDDVVLMHCVSSYPAAPSELNLKFITWMRENMNCQIGYSDHADGIEASKIALCLGARVIEKHFTSDKNFSTFRDHALSANPQELKTLVEFAKNIDAYLGSEEKVLALAEIKEASQLKRGLYARHKIEKGKTIEIEDVIEKRPTARLNAGEEQKIIGTSARKTFQKGDAF